MTSLNNEKQYSVLISPLDWGLGHATRCIPLISYLLEKKCIVSVAGEGQHIELIKKEFPGLIFFPLHGYKIQYPKKGVFFTPKLVSQLPKIIISIIKEHQWLKRNLNNHKWDLVISDNRYGLYSTEVKSIFITHQTQIISGLGKWIDVFTAYVLKCLIERFEQCWIPDHKGINSISGELSGGNCMPRNSRFIGPVSRLENNSEHSNEHILVLLSGPEPQRSILEELLIAQLKCSNEKILFIRGLPMAKSSLESTDNIIFINHFDAHELSRSISNAKLVICRSGYSTIMDLLKLNKKALLIPTPGQTEQLYLAERMNKFDWFTMQQQEELNVIEGINKTLSSTGPRPQFEFEGYKQAFIELGIQ